MPDVSAMGIMFSLLIGAAITMAFMLLFDTNYHRMWCLIISFCFMIIITLIILIGK